MATEPQRSEIMSGAPSSSELASSMPPQTGVSADAALIVAALGRMEATVRHERAAFDRLRVMLGEMAEAIAKASSPNQLGRSSGVELVAGDAIAQVKAGEFEVRFEAVVRDTDAQLIAGQLLTRGFKFGTVGEGASECRGNVRVGQITDRLGLVNKFEIQNTDRRIQVGANDLTELIFGLFERVFRLDHTNAA